MVSESVLRTCAQLWSRPNYFYQHPSEKFNGQKLAELMPVLTFEEFSESKNCANGLDDILLARPDSNITTVKNLAAYEAIYSGQSKSHETFKILTDPKNYENGTTSVVISKTKTHLPLEKFIDKKKNQVYILMGSEKARNAYDFDNENSKCVMWLQPYRNMDFIHNLEMWSDKKVEMSSDRKSMKENHSSDQEFLENKMELAARVILATTRPEEVVAAAEYFLNEVLNLQNIQNIKNSHTSHAAMHWRYDHDDYGIHCRANNVTKGVCGSMNKGFDRRKISKNIASHLSDVNKEFLEFTKLHHKSSSSAIKITSIYIAAPPKEYENIEIMKSEFENKANDFNLNFKTFYGKDLKIFLKNRFKLCNREVYNDQIHDFLSLVEMEICSRSKIFIYSGGSSWSKNIRQERWSLRTHVLDVANEDFL